MRLAPLSLSLAMLLLISGCARRPNIPTYPQMSDSAALEILARRAGSITALSGEGQLRLSREGGQGVQLDAAIAMRPPDHVRLRAWKFGQAVFDLTLTPQGLWIASPREGGRESDIRAAGISAGEFARAWSLLSGGFFADPGVTTQTQGPWLIARLERGSEPTIVCHVDRATLTPRRYIMQDQRGATLFTLQLDRYEAIAGTVWPRRVVAVSESGRIMLELRELELNGELPERAFVPPARAERIQ